MIRLIKIGRQILDEEGRRDFALFNTITDAFLEFAGDQVFESIAHLEQSMKIHQVPDHAQQRLLLLSHKYALDEDLRI